MNSPVAKIKERLSIEEVVSSYIKLEKAGVNLKAKCPFHNEKTPSFFISPNRGSYYCFGCGASGDIFTFVEEFEGLDFKGALKMLADKAGVTLEVYSRENKEAESEKEKLYRAIEEAAKYFENNLKENTKESAKVLEYLKSRGLTEKSIKDFRIGFIKNDWRLLYNYLKNKFSDLEMEKAGLVKKTEKGYYDRFRGRIMFPIADSSGRIIAFSGRIFADDPSTSSGQVVQAKYLNSPDTLIFSKSAVLYGLDKAKESIRKNNFSILVEGQMDLILSHQAGYKNTIATSGTALSDSTISRENVISNLGLIRRLSANIVLAFDGDKAGFNASMRATRIALSLGMDVKVALMPEGVDPADLISKSGPDSWREAIKNSKHIIEFLLEKVLKNSGNDARKAGREIKEKILPFVDALESSIEKMHFVKKISDASSIPQSALQDDLKKIEHELKYEKREIEKEETFTRLDRKDYIERKLLSIAFWQKSLATPVVDFERIFKNLGEVCKKYENIERDLIFEAEIFYDNNKNLEKSIQEMFLNLEEENINEELGKKMLELKQTLNTESEKNILQEINELNKKKENIKNNRLNNKNI